MRIILNKLRTWPERPVTLMLAAIEPAPTPVNSPLGEAVEQVLLSALPAGSHARVARVNAHSDDLRRLQALGVCVGRRVQLVKSGDPMIISVVGARVGLSARLAAEVLVTPVDAHAPNLVPLANAS
jgi:Fe2+ transport system protein FeoA